MALQLHPLMGSLPHSLPSKEFCLEDEAKSIKEASQMFSIPAEVPEYTARLLFLLAIAILIARAILLILISRAIFLLDISTIHD